MTLDSAHLLTAIYSDSYTQMTEPANFMKANTCAEVMRQQGENVICL